jgi:hypothetical protein
LACTHNEDGISRIHHAPQPRSHDQCEEIKRLRLLNSTLLARSSKQLPRRIPIPPHGYTKPVEKKDIHADHDVFSVHKEKESFNSEQLEFLILLKTNHGLPPKNSKPPFTPRQIEELREMGIMKDRPAFNTMQMDILQLMSPDPDPASIPTPQKNTASPQASYPNQNPSLVPHASEKAFPGHPNMRRRMTHPLNRTNALEEKRFPYPPQIYQTKNNSLRHSNASLNPPQQSHRNDPKSTHHPPTEVGRDTGLPVCISYP